jgi:hypothetical protein
MYMNLSITTIAPHVSVSLAFDMPPSIVDQFMQFGDGAVFGEQSFSWIDEPRNANGDANNGANNSNSNNNNNNNNNNLVIAADSVNDGGDDDVDDDADDDNDDEEDFDQLDEIDFDDFASGGDSRMPSDVAAMLRTILQQRADRSEQAAPTGNSASNNNAASNANTNTNNSNSGSGLLSAAPFRFGRRPEHSPPPAVASESRPAASAGESSELGSSVIRKFIVPPSLSAVSTPHSGRFVCPVCGPQGVSGAVQGVIGDHVGADELRSLQDMGLIFTEMTLVAHFLHDHQEARTSMVCPICASRPDGIADYATSNIVRHMMLRHRPSIGAFGGARDLRAPPSVCYCLFVVCAEPFFLFFRCVLACRR